MLDKISMVIIIIGVVFVSIGVVGIYRFKNFYSRALVASKVDTVGYMTLMIGIMLRSGVNFFSAKVFVILLITMLVNPLITHSIVRSAYISGYKIRKD
ncbi:MAG TPA: cation:proton antiporter [Clostridiales bacterium UBA8960]|nr:cation:proton antiporter [Clostridiales bacterium UBA8960]